MLRKKQPAKHSPDRHQVVKDKEKILSFLKGDKVGVLSTVDPNGSPHAAVLYYSVNDNLEIAFLTKNDTKKFDNLERNNKAAFVVFDALSQATAQVYGHVQHLTSVHDIQAVFESALKASLDTSGSAAPPISKINAGNYVAVKLVPSYAKLSIYAEPRESKPGELFQKLQTFEYSI